jgi:hypothetical protein
MPLALPGRQLLFILPACRGKTSTEGRPGVNLGIGKIYPNLLSNLFIDSTRSIPRRNTSNRNKP